MSRSAPLSRPPWSAAPLLAALLALAPAGGLGAQTPAAPEGAPAGPGGASEADTSSAAVADRGRPPQPRLLPDLRLEPTLAYALTAAQASYLDPGFRSAMLRARSPALDDLAGAAEWLGDWSATLPYLLGGTAAVGGLTDGTRGLARGASFLGGVVAGAMVNEVVNRAVGRQRPWVDGDPYDFEPFRGHTSFPSGHTAFAFSIAGGLDALTDGWIPAVAYGSAGLTGLSRMYHDKHWFADVVVGALIGAKASHYATRQLLLLTGTADPPASEPPSGEGASGAGEGEGGPGDRAGGPRFVVTPAFVGLRLRF